MVFGRKEVKQRKDPNPAPYVKIIRRGQSERVGQACQVLLDSLSDEEAIRCRSQWGRRSWEQALKDLESVQPCQPTAVTPVLEAYRLAWDNARAVLDDRRKKYLRFRSQLHDWYTAVTIPEGKNAITWLAWNSPKNNASPEMVKADVALTLDPSVDRPNPDNSRMVWPHDYESSNQYAGPLAAQMSEHLDPEETFEFAVTTLDERELGHLFRSKYCWLVGTKRLYHFKWPEYDLSGALTRHGSFAYLDVSLTPGRIVKNHYKLTADNHKTANQLGEDEVSSIRDYPLYEEFRNHELLIQALSQRLQASQ